MKAIRTRQEVRYEVSSETCRDRSRPRAVDGAELRPRACRLLLLRIISPLLFGWREKR